MAQPSASISLDDETKELTKTDLIIQFGSHTVRVRQISVSIDITQSHVEDAELHVGIRDHEIPRAIRLPRTEAVGWGSKIEPVTGEEIIFYEKHVADSVHKMLSAQQSATLRAGLGYFAAILFTVEGHQKAYLTTKNLYELPMGKAYRLTMRLVGEGLTFPPTVGIYVELNDWNDTYVSYDYVTWRAYRVIVRWVRKHTRPSKGKQLS